MTKFRKLYKQKLFDGCVAIDPNKKICVNTFVARKPPSRKRTGFHRVSHQKVWEQLYRAQGYSKETFTAFIERFVATGWRVVPVRLVEVME